MADEEAGWILKKIMILQPRPYNRQSYKMLTEQQILGGIDRMNGERDDRKRKRRLKAVQAPRKFRGGGAWHKKWAKV
jgi:hypothetical protein